MGRREIGVRFCGEPPGCPGSCLHRRISGRSGRWGAFAPGREVADGSSAARPLVQIRKMIHTPGNAV
jgi:hypothetical protein